MKAKWLLGIGFAVGFSALALAQAVTVSNLAGTEIVLGQVGGVGGGGIAIPDYVLRSGENHTLVATGTTVTTQIPASSGIVLATGAISTWNVNLPLKPYTGQKVIIGCPGGTVSTLSITATAPASVSIVGTNPTSCTSGGLISQGAAFTYSTSANKWYRFL